MKVFRAALEAEYAGIEVAGTKARLDEVLYHYHSQCIYTVYSPYAVSVVVSIGDGKDSAQLTRSNS